ncbi:AraC family transcriptional regulator [Noviherbaspirillum saxi]|uniref:AraC family transcriptional regulator n=1 Tax=Noviherbaspirillum saxi TaxID=2320863 RepID=A0A3A3FKS7_9BURK|nr:helix-turn-helix transcriptional regulator [Noviherbaspirillum saxi]RJF91945.1 AraC family transcriptional regulator [Noviherbaspirillum saxi]
MKHRPSDIFTAPQSELNSLRTLPRPVYGHIRGLPNRPIGHRHTHSWVQLSYALHGVIEVVTSTGRFVAPPLRAIWIPARVPHAVRCAPHTEIRSLYIESAAVPRHASECRVLAVTPLTRELIRTFSEFPAEYDEQGTEGRLVQVLLDQLACAPELGLSLPWPQDARLRHICTEMNAKPDGGASLADYGARLHLSERTLSRLFRQQTGLSFRLWRQRARILSALPLLERGDRVTDVALACGYESMSAFIAAFREQMGMTPGELLAACAMVSQA